MSGSGAPYDKAIASFEALLAASTSAAHARPMRLIQDSGQHLTSGYRHTAVLEAEGFLRRDEHGVYLRGAAALRTGLNAYGFGHLAPVLPPILRRLREATQHTAFFAIVHGASLSLGPYSQGRATRHVRLGATYGLDQAAPQVGDDPARMALRPGTEDMAEGLHALLIAVPGGDGVQGAFGFVLNPARALEPGLPDALRLAAQQVAP